MIKEEVLGKSYVNKLKYEYVKQSFDDIDFKLFFKDLIEESGFKFKSKNIIVGNVYAISFGISDTDKMNYLSNMLKENKIVV